MASVNKKLQTIVKRGIDIVGSGTGLILLSALYLCIGVAILTKMGFPIFFRHQRPGLKNKPFTMYKFRTMRHTRPGEDPYYTDLDRLTGLGKFLKKYSLDELPEFFNVLKGDMSLVGPRPLLMEYLEKYTTDQLRRHNVKPGITGWAQVNGRTGITLSEKFEMDLWYVDNWTLELDSKILLMTISQVLRPSKSVVVQDHTVIDDLGFLEGSTRSNRNSGPRNVHQHDIKEKKWRI